MALQFVTDINVDFYDKRYILINAKQYDKNSRFLSITCYNHGKVFPLNAGEHAAYIRYKKPDGYSVFNFCEINNKGKILVELTEQMLAINGVACADLVVVRKGDASVDSKTGEIVTIENASVLSSMLLHIDVSHPSIDNAEIESTHEFNLLNTRMEEYWADFEDVMKTSKSWAVGSTGIRDGENTNNSKYWSTQSKNSSDAANTSAINAANSESNANSHMQDALAYSQNAQTYMNKAKDYMDSADESEANALSSANAAKTSETNAKDSENKALVSEQNAKVREGNALISEQNAKVSETNAATSEGNASTSEANALVSEQNAKVSETNAATSEGNAKKAQEAAEIAEQNAEAAAEQAAQEAAQEAVNNVLTLMDGHVTASQEAATNAKNSESAALVSEQNAKISEDNARMSMDSALESKTAAYNSEINAESYMSNAQISKDGALNSANKAQSYAVGGTSTRDGEDTDNAYYYYELIKNIVNGLDTGFIPMGTIYFSELSEVEKAVGYVYNISDEFITDDTFREGSGNLYTAGTNVYYTANGEWDCFGGAVYPIATVNEVKDYLNI